MLETVSIQAFVFAIAFASLFGLLTKEYHSLIDLGSVPGRILAKLVRAHIVLGMSFVGYMILFLAPVIYTRNINIIGCVFGWICVHGIPAFFVGRLCYISNRLLRVKCRATQGDRRL